MLKILQITAPTTAGGLERVVEALAVGHHRRGHDVTVVALLLDGSEAHPFVESLRAEGVRVEALRLPPRGYLSERREIGRICRKIRPDVAHTHGYRIDLVDRDVVARLGIPTVTTIHGATRFGGIKAVFLEWLQRMNYRYFDGVVAVSSPLYERAVAEGVRPERIHLIPNAWGGLQEALPREEARRRLGLDPGVPVVGWVGRLFPVKGGDVFLRAMSLLDHPRPMGAMIGYGPQASDLRREAQDLGLTDSVRFYPGIRDAGRYFRAFDTYVLSSRSEGLPIVILEAMAAGTPIVATRVGGVTDALGGEAGWLVPPEDPEALSRAITESLSDRAAAQQRVRRAEARLESEFALDAFLDRHERVYEGVASRSAR